MLNGRFIRFSFGGGAMALVLVLAGCGGADEPPEAGSSSVTEAPPEVSSTSTTEAGPTSTTEASTTEAPPAATDGARFVISAVAFGESGYVEVTNVGDTAGSLEGFWVCQRPSYQPLSGTLAPGETVRFEAATSGYGSLDADAGEMGLYSSSDFGSSDAIIAYVAWGDSGQGRFGTAVEGGVWTEGSMVDATGASMLTAVETAPISAEGWSTG
ncbi:MAG: hypothetical protein BMS9Abin07_1720 [Acidimicrobiia bacterium]|nr:MAG: hypothetical protein BMS9Abin07_1720 [Acidimicrobiia bacterium]